MKLLTFEKDGAPRAGALVDGKVVDLNLASRALMARHAAVFELPERMEDFVRGPEQVLACGHAVVDLVANGAAVPGWAVRPRDQVKLLPPLVNPPKIICVARNYAEHAKEAGLEPSQIPILFARFSATLVADGDPVIVPKVSPQLDWEGELAVVIGKPTSGRRVSRAAAMDYVFGYSIFNDVTVRDYQFRVPQYTAGKNFRSSGPFGPCIVTADAVGDPHNLQITTKLNGAVMQSANTSTMIFDIPTLIEHISDFIDLEAGDVIPTGTPAGVGFKRKPPVFLKHGDEVAVEISNIGVLRNPVRDEV
jgi:2-keto-4-pentenoate hydratase/2-oxohepta-3-ene-1,7-dioic acid hydratase in catechol pathway